MGLSKGIVDACSKFQSTGVLPLFSWYKVQGAVTSFTLMAIGHQVQKNFTNVLELRIHGSYFYFSDTHVSYQGNQHTYLFLFTESNQQNIKLSDQFVHSNVKMFKDSTDCSIIGSMRVIHLCRKSLLSLLPSNNWVFQLQNPSLHVFFLGHSKCLNLVSPESRA